MSRNKITDKGDPDVVFDDDNPEWTKEDFARARPPHEIFPPEILAAFPKTRGVQQAPKKVAISIRLSQDVIDFFKSSGPGWQTRIDETLKKAIGGKR